MSDPTSDDGLYDFVDESPAAASKPRAKSTAAPVPVVPLPVEPPAALQYRAKKEDKPKPLEIEQIKHVYLPLWLLLGGVFVKLLAAIIWTHQIGNALLELAVDLTLGTAVMLVAMMIAAKVRGIDLGKLQIAAYKLAAVSIAPAAVMEFINPIASMIPLGGILAFVVEFVLFFALLGALFDLDESDTWYCVCVMFVTRVALYFGLMVLFKA